MLIENPEIAALIAVGDGIFFKVVVDIAQKHPRSANTNFLIPGKGKLYSLQQRPHTTSPHRQIRELGRDK
jgi:hypothetical protein